MSVKHEDRTLRVETNEGETWVFTDSKGNKVLEANFEGPAAEQKARATSMFLAILRTRIYGLDWVKESAWDE